jgi:hypothetical protein
MYSRRKWHARSVAFERLEARHMLAGTVYCEISGSMLTINGDDSGNKIVVHQLWPHGAPAGDQYGAFPFVPAIRIRGVGTKIRVVNDSLPSPLGIAAQTSPPKHSITVSDVSRIHIAMAGGNDSVTMYNTIFDAGPLTVDMGDGNNTLRMSNVHVLYGFAPLWPGHYGFEPLPPELQAPPSIAISMGAGKDRAALRNVTSGGDMSIASGEGGDRINLKSVAAGAASSHQSLRVDMEAGRHDVLKVMSCTAGNAIFSEVLGSDGVLIRSANKFAVESDNGFASII